MRRTACTVALACSIWAAPPSAQDATAPPQTFRSGVDLVRIDVTVLDRNHKPIRGLTSADFTIKENGRPQRIVALTEVDVSEADPTPAAWMRYASRNVASNNLADTLGDGQAVAVVLDDFHTPDDSTEMAVGTREVARYIVDSLGPSDLAAVVHPFKPGRTQDFTRDRAKLLTSIDKFESEQPEYMVLQPRLPGPTQGDIQRQSPALGRDPCFQVQPVIPTLRAVTSQLATVPERRKALFFISVGVPFTFTSRGNRCQGLLYDEMRRTFETAQRFNVNIHGIDPAGAAGYMRFIQQPRLRNARLVPGESAARASEIAHLRHDFLETLGEQTGGRPVVDTDDLQGAISSIFQEYSSYYLIGYETAPNFDGRFRDVSVSVQRRDVEVRTRRGRWAPDDKDRMTVIGPKAQTCVFDCWHVPPKPSEVQLTGLRPYEPLGLRAAAHPIGPAVPKAVDVQRETDVMAVITVRLPAVLRTVDDTLTLVRTVYDANGSAAPPVVETFTRRLEPGAGDETRYDVWSRFPLSPGRYDVRFNATSRLADASGSVHVEVVVPDWSQGPSASPIVLGTEPHGGERAEPLATVMSVVPTTARDFDRDDQVTALITLSSGPSAPRDAVTIQTTVIGSDGAAALEMPASLVAATDFVRQEFVGYRLELPLRQLRPGLYLLSMTATFDRDTPIRRDVLFRVR